VCFAKCSPSRTVSKSHLKHVTIVNANWCENEIQGSDPWLVQNVAADMSTVLMSGLMGISLLEQWLSLTHVWCLRCYHCQPVNINALLCLPSTQVVYATIIPHVFSLRHVSAWWGHLQVCWSLCNLLLLIATLPTLASVHMAPLTATTYRHQLKTNWMLPWSY
jgi:hypothetical protein